MAPFGTIYSYPGNFRVQRAQVLASLNGLEVTEDPNFQFGVTNKTPEFISKFPMGKVPAFEGADGFCLAESAAICMYLAGSGPQAGKLLGTDAQAKARIAEWSIFSENELTANVITPIAMAVFKLYPWDEAKFNSCMDNFELAVKRIEPALAGGKKFLVGEEFTLADAMVGSVLHFATKFLLDAEMRKGVPNVVAYLKALAEVPEFKKVFGELKMCETRAKAE